MTKNNQYFQEILDVLIEIAYLLVAFLVPLFFAFLFPTYNIFELNKIFIFKVLVLVLLFFTVIKITFFYNSQLFLNLGLKKTWLLIKKYLIFPLLLIVILGFSLLFSLNPEQSFYGSYSRQQGLTSYLFYFLFFLLMTFNLTAGIGLKTDKKLEKKMLRLLITMVISGALVGLYGIFQVLGVDFLTWPEDPAMTFRTLSTFGQPNFLASWLLLVIPLTLYFFWQAKRLIISLLYFLAFACQFLALIFTSSRGALLAFVVVIVFFLLFVWLKQKINRSQKLAILVLLLSLIFVSLAALHYFLPQRFDSFFNFKTGSLAARVNFYVAAVDAIIQKPVFGYGLENSGEVFIRYYQPEWGIYGDVAASTDRAHNLLLDILLSVGLTGLIFYGLFYYSFFRLGLENIRHSWFANFSLALILGGLGYLVSLFFSFSIVAGEVYFWLFLAILTAINFGPINRGDLVNSGVFKEEKTATIAEMPAVTEGEFLGQVVPAAETKKVIKINRQRKIIIGLLISLIAAILIAWRLNSEFRILQADYYFNSLYYTLGAKDYSTAFVLDDYIRESKSNPVNQEFYNLFLGDKLSELYPNIAELTPQKIATDKLRLVLSELRDSGHENWLVKGKIYSAFKQYQLAENYFNLVSAESPSWPKSYLEKARNFWRAKEFSQAFINYRLADSNLPDLHDSRFNAEHLQVASYFQSVIYQEMATIYFTDGKYEQAAEYYLKAYRDRPSDFTILKKIADSYYLLGNLDLAIRYVQEGFRYSPKDYNWPLALAALNKEKGNAQQALVYLDQALELAPSNQELLKLKEEYLKP